MSETADNFTGDSDASVDKLPIKNNPCPSRQVENTHLPEHTHRLAAALSRTFNDCLAVAPKIHNQRRVFLDQIMYNELSL